MDYAQAREYLLSFVNYERKDRFAYNTRTWNLRAFRAFLDELSAPDRDLCVVHIAGTNGKGAVAAALTTLLLAAGEAVGLYTSPHLVTMLERIRLDGELVDESTFVAGVECLREVQRRLGHGENGGYRTTFELLTALALLVFRQSGMRWAVLETGLGGRLDATNVVERPELCLLTSIARDHENVLGEGLEHIALEKAGILKPGTPALAAPQVDEVRRVLEKRADELGVFLEFVGTDPALSLDDTGRVSYRGAATALRGRAQLINLSLALAAYRHLAAEHGLPLDAQGPGLTALRWPGRLELVRRRPDVLLDGGHNPAALSATLEVLAGIPARRRVCLFGASANKDLHALCRLVGEAFDEVYPTAADNPRAADPARLAELLPHAKVHLGPGDAVGILAGILEGAGDNDLIAVLGSLFLVGEVKARAAKLGLDGSLDIRLPGTAVR